MSETQQLATKALARSPFQKERKPTAELIDSVKQHGIIQPLVVRPIAQANGVTHEIIAGERRWRAAQANKLADVPVIVRQASDIEARELQTTENLQRADYNPIEEAEAYHGLLESYKQEGIEGEQAIARLCAKVGKAKATVYERLRLLKLPPEIKAATSSGELPPSHAGLIAKLEHTPDVMKEVAQRIMKPDRGADKDGKVLSFRGAKQVVEEAEEHARARAEWRQAAEKHEKAGGKLLSEEDSARLLRYGYLEHNSGYVLTGSYCEEYGGIYEQLVPKKAGLTRYLGHGRSYNAYTMYRRSEALAAIKASGRSRVSSQSGGSGESGAAAARAKAAAAETRKKTARRRALVEAIVTAAKTTAVQVDDFLPFVLGAMHQRALSDTIREMFNRRGLDRNKFKTAAYGSPHNVWMKREIEAARTPGDYLALIVDLGIALDLSAWGGQGTGEKLLNQAARMLRVNPKRVAAPAVKKQKVQTAGKAKKTPARTKQPKVTRKTLLTAAARKRLSAAMKARWAARRKAAAKS